jgi:WD40 repeat protein
VFHYDTMELVGIARSYFGGLLCVCWSPDSKYVAVGGEDDLVTLWSFHDKQIIARGQGHHSWINVVSFDPFTSSIPPADQSPNSHNHNYKSAYPPSISHRNLVEQEECGADAA